MCDLLDELLDEAADGAGEPQGGEAKPPPLASACATPGRGEAQRPPAKRAAPGRGEAQRPADPARELTEADAAAEGSKFKLSSMKEAVRKKGMWAGALKPIDIPDLFGAVPAAAPDSEAADGKEGPEAGAEAEPGPPAAPKARGPGVALVDISRPHTPALLKVFDEIIVNATDHAKTHEKGPAGRRVTRIDVTLDPRTGRVTVFNDGPGIPVVRHPEASAQAGREVYVPEVAFAWFLAGTNVDKEKDLTNVRGGINGLGAKLANAHSVEFLVETVDSAAGRSYLQRWRDRLDVTEPPQVAPLPKARAPRPHTRVSFVPAYAALGYRVAPQASGPALLEKADAADLDAWLRLRAHQAAAYAGARVVVSYNGARCATTDAAALARLLLAPLGEDAGQALVLTAQLKAAGEPWSLHPWSLAVVVLPPGRKAGRRAAAQNMMIVNGVLSNKGSHVKYLKGLLSAAVEDKLRRATKRGRAPAAKGAKAGGGDDRKMGVAETLAGVRLVMCGAIPGADWGGQRKDELQVPKETLERYALPAAFLKQAGDAVAERILVAQGGGKAGKFVHDKYTRARFAGRAALKRDTFLLAAEGDSAITLLRAGLTQSRKAAPPGGPSLDWCGVISLQGVVPNAAREVTEVETSEGDVVNVRSAKLQNNKRLAALADAMGLRYDRAYASAEELATLHYGRLLLCVDQDLDGTGKIAALVLVWVWTFWPALVRAGRVGRLMTPLIRAYPKRGGAPVEFFYEAELRAWLEEDPARADLHRIQYYKGLAGHDEAEVRRMFAPEAFRRSVYAYTVDDAAARRFEVYFGASPALRKEALASPVAFLSAAETRELRRLQRIPVGRVQLDVDTKAYKNDAISRQIPGAVDGLNPARRKILAGAFLRFGAEKAARPIKVFQLGGYVADRLFYHHGDASLSKTIVFMAQAFPGARQYPYLTGVGQFGSRHGDKAGSPRYIGVRLGPLARAAFPPADRWHLPYVFEDGERAEPRYFVPVAPMAALESYRIVSEAWNHTSFGRDYAACRAVVDAFIGGDPELVRLGERLHAEGATPAVLGDLARAAARWPLPASARGHGGEVRIYRGEPHSFGAYRWDAAARTVTVTELPLGLATAKYLAALTGPGRGGKENPRAAFIESVEDRSTADAVELAVVLRAGGFERLSAEFGDSEADPIEDALLLRGSLRPHLNYYSAGGGVLELGEAYLAAVLYWAPVRRDLYRERLQRAQTVAELRIVEEKEILRYIGLAAELDLAKAGDDDAAAGVLRCRGFPPLNSALLHRPEYTPNGSLRRLVTSGPGASHDYILNLKERDLVKKAADTRRKRLAALVAEFDLVTAQLAERPTPGASVWRAELAAFEKVVEEGVKTRWKFGKEGAEVAAPSEREAAAAGAPPPEEEAEAGE